MISLDKAYDILMASARTLDGERVPFAESMGRILSEDLVADRDLPPFNKCAMDGYACRRRDLAGELSVLETIAAGASPTRTIGQAQCSKVMTGAMLPDGADCVIMVEFTENISANTIRFTGKSSEDNFCRCGEDLKAGAIVLRRGSLIRPQEIAVMATIGCTDPLVSRRPRVGVISTGHELVEPSAIPGPCSIRNSNSSQLCAQVAAAGGQATYYGIADDTEAEIGMLLDRSTGENNVTILSGGVSAGDFDFVPDILRERGFTVLFDSVAVKPGKPTLFASKDDAVCFGLPGNPVSSFVVFELMVRPFLCKMTQYGFAPTVIPMTLTEPVSRRKTDRDAWLPVRNLTPESVITIDYNGPAHLTALTAATGLICMPRGTENLDRGTTVHVRQI